jgi:tetratricopeptide (TPR) repeat protein
MELVKGVPITEYCDANRLTPRERLELLLHVCEAVQHAHQKGIIHRDIKPSNVLVVSHDGTSVVKVIDFGVAKALAEQLTEKTVYTQFAQLIGTPLYMSPEQAGESSLDIDLKPEYELAHYNLGMVFAEQNYLDQAIAECRKAIDLKPGHVEAHQLLGYLLKKQGKLDQAIEAYQKAVQLRPDDVQLHINLAVLLRDHGDRNEALAEFRHVVKLKPDHAPAYVDLGNLLRQQRKVAEALAEYRKALAVKPDCGGALWSLAALLANGRDPKLRDPRTAVDLAKKGIALEGHAGWWQALGWAHYRAGAYKEAIAALEKSIALNKDGANADQWLFLAMAHWQLGQKEEARHWYDRSVAWIDNNREALDRENCSGNRLVDDVRKFRAEAAELMGIKQE